MRSHIKSLAVTLLLITLQVEAATITVNTDTSGSGCTLMDAIDSANADSAMGGCNSSTTGVFGDDTIVLPPDQNIQTLFEVNNSNGVGSNANGLPVVTSNIVIEGNGGLIWRSSSSLTPEFRLFYVTTGASLTLKNVHLKNGASPNGSAIFNYGGTVELDHCVVQNNSVDDPGNNFAIYNNSVGSFSAHLTLKHTDVTGNTAVAIASTQSGGLTGGANSQLIIEDSKLSSNTGRGISIATGSANIRRSEIAYNLGGGIGIINDVSVQVRDSTISHNTNTYGGGGIVITSSVGPPTVTLINNTISENTASPGGGINQTAGSLSLVNNLISGNHASGAGADIYRNGGTSGRQRNNLFGESSHSTAQSLVGFTVDPSDITATSDGSDPTPLDGIIGDLQNNGGPTRTHRLVPGRPALNAAVSTYYQSFLFQEGCAYTSLYPSVHTIYRNDQRGTRRLHDAKCDIGAYEEEGEAFYVIPLPGGKEVIFGL